MNVLKYVLLVLVGLILGAAIVLAFPPSPFKTALGTVAEGNFYLQNGLPKTALDKYEQAQKQWPLLRLDRGFQQQLEKAKEERTKKVALTIYLKDNTTDSQTQSLVDEIKAISGVREVKLLSKEEALNLYKKKFKDDPLLTQYVTEDILPTTISVYLDDLSVKDQISQLAESKTFVDEVVKSLDKGTS